MRGIWYGVVIGAVMWLFIIAVILHQSVMAELGRKAVEQGLIP